MTQFYNNMLCDVILSCANLSTIVAAANVGKANLQLPLLNNIIPSFVPTFSFNHKLTSHSNKKHTVRIADKVPALNTMWVCYWAGWLKKCDHTIFKYFTANMKNNWQAGKALCGWRQLDTHGHIEGRHPPQLHTLLAHDHDGTVENFVRSLFWHFVHPHWSNEFKCLLAASILMHLPRFIDLLLDHPNAKFGTTSEEARNKHPFLQAINIALVGSNISHAMLLEWCKDVDHDFTERNYAFVAMRQVENQEAVQQNQNPHPCYQVNEHSIISVLMHLADTC